ncbi:MAG: error-prone DNA polymerase [Solirubrobacterales bacterium]
MTGTAPYIELHAHSAYSFLDGASTPLELAYAAEDYGYPALAVTDHDGVWGSREFAESCKDLGLRAITGTELTVALPEQAPPLLPGGEPALAHLTLLAEDAGGYHNLCRLLTKTHAHTRDNTGRSASQPWATFEQLEEHAEGLVCLSGCARDGVLAGRWERGETELGERLGRRLLAAFGRERFRVELQRPFWRHDRARNRWLALLAERIGVPCVATGNVHSHARCRGDLQDALVAVRRGESLEESEPFRRGNRSSVLVSPEEMAARFAEYPEAVAETVRLAERLRFDLTNELGYRYPREGDEQADVELAQLAWNLLGQRYVGEALPRQDHARGRLDHELKIIRDLGLSGFFLLHHDLLQLAREVAAEVRPCGSARALMPAGRGRGSSVSSIVCFLTGLSHVDPVKAELFSGRFLNEESQSMPDIDLDFPRDVREKLIPRVHERFGADRSALVAAFPTYRPRGVVRDLGKALGLWPAEIEKVARVVGFHESKEEIAADVAAAIGPERAASPGWQALLRLGGEALGLPRHASQHSGGMVISTRPLIDLCPVVPAAMEGRQIVQWDKDSCADAGFLKLDLLGLGMLSAVERCVDEIEAVRGETVDLARIDLKDAQTYEAIQRAETTGVFQIESRAQMQMLPRTHPETLEDVIVQVALVRPGPIQGGAVHPYIERRKRQRQDPDFEIPYEHPLLEEALRETLGTIVYQEQVIEVAVALADFSHAEAEQLRRAMSRKRSREAMDRNRDAFLVGAVGTKGVPLEVAERVWEQIEGFSGFGFPKAHSAAFGLLAYQTAYLRVHYGPEFLCALLNEQPMGFYPPDSLAHEAQRRGIRMAPPDANQSRVLCHVERERGGPLVRVGLGYVKGVREEEMEALVAERERGGPYRGIAELASRSGAGYASLERLAWAGALDGIPVGEAGERREALWRVGVAGAGRGRSGSEQLALAIEPPEPPRLKPLGDWGKMIADYRSTGISLGPHPMRLMRPNLEPELLRSSDLERVEDGSEVEVAGMVVARQRPETARGIVFMLLEDERGAVNLVVPPPVYDRHRQLVRSDALIRARGRLERREGVINVLVAELAPLERTRAAAPPPTRQSVASTRRRQRELAVAELKSVAPVGHSFGRRGR